MVAAKFFLSSVVAAACLAEGVNVKSTEQNLDLNLVAAKVESLIDSKFGHQKTSNTLAAKLQELSKLKRGHRTATTSLKQEPAVDATVDAEAYAADWQNEHKSGPYPESAEGKEHDEDYGETVKPALERALFFNSWFFWISCGIFIVLATGAGAKYYSVRARA